MHSSVQIRLQIPQNVHEIPKFCTTSNFAEVKEKDLQKKFTQQCTHFFYFIIFPCSCDANNGFCFRKLTLDMQFIRNLRTFIGFNHSAQFAHLRCTENMELASTDYFSLFYQPNLYNTIPLFLFRMKILLSHEQSNMEIMEQMQRETLWLLIKITRFMENSGSFPIFKSDDAVHVIKRVFMPAIWKMMEEMQKNKQVLT